MANFNSEYSGLKTGFGQNRAKVYDGRTRTTQTPPVFCGLIKSPQIGSVSPEQTVRRGNSLAQNLSQYKQQGGDGPVSLNHTGADGYTSSKPIDLAKADLDGDEKISPAEWAGELHASTVVNDDAKTGNMYLQENQNERSIKDYEEREQYDPDRNRQLREQGAALYNESLNAVDKGHGEFGTTTSERSAMMSNSGNQVSYQSTNQGYNTQIRNNFIK